MIFKNKISKEERMKKTNKEIRKILEKKAKKEEKKKEDCAICLEPTESKIKCGHYFHTECLDNWLQYNSCPVCREPIDETKKVEKCKYTTEEEDAELARELAREIPRGDMSGDLFYLLMHALIRGIPERNMPEMNVTVYCRGCHTQLSNDFPVIICEQCEEGYFCCDICVERCSCRRHNVLREARQRVERQRVVNRQNIRQEREDMIRQVESEAKQE